MSNKEKQIKIGLEEWKVLHSVKTDTEVSMATIISSILKNIKKEDIITWVKQNLK